MNLDSTKTGIRLATSRKPSKSRFILPMLFAVLPALAPAAQLTEMETRWLTAGAPVLAYAKQLKLPVDIVVQPEARPGDVPLALGFDGGRCKLVLSMRGNPGAEDILEKLPTEQRALMIQAMTAHEIGHCWRYAQGSWHMLPAGFVEQAQEASDAEVRKLAQELRDTRREEAFSDLVALAWIQRSQPAQYARVYSWLQRLRDAQPSSHSSHDTRAWLRLAADSAVFSGADTPFEQARALWNQGLLGEN